MPWLRRFLFGSEPPDSTDPVVELIGALSQPEAEMWRELLANNGIVAMVKDVSPHHSGGMLPMGSDCVLLVRQRDLERARELLQPAELSDEDAGFGEQE
jgi:hypothetical protein